MRDRWSVSLVVSGDGPLVRKAEEAGVGVTIVPFPRALARLGDSGDGAKVSALRSVGRAGAVGWATARYCLRLRRALRDLAPDVVHTNGLKMHVLGAWCRPGGARVVWHVHDYVSPRPVVSRLLRALSRRCNAVIANSRSVARDVEHVVGPGLSVHPVYNAIDLSRFAPEGPVLDLDMLSGMAPSSSACVRVGLLATMAHWKGHEVFLQALSLLPPDLPLRAYLIGGAIYETDTEQWSLPRLRSLAGELGLAGRIGFTDFVDDPSAAIRALDIVVHASVRPEPFGRVIVEAMACGKPVVISAAGGATELVEPEVDALTHEPGDAAALAYEIRRLAMDPQLRASLGGRARATSLRRYDRSRLPAELEVIYGQVTA